MKKLLTVIKIFLGICFLFNTSSLFAFDWAPKKDFFNQEKKDLNLLLKIVKGQSITYCIDGDFSSNIKPANSFVFSYRGFMQLDRNYDTHEAEYVFQKWFKNILKRAKKYPNFEKDFRDILPILKNPVKMKKVACGPIPKEYSFPGFYAQNIDYKLNTEKEDLRIVFTSQETLKEVISNTGIKEDLDGFYTLLSDRNLIWIAKSDILTERATLLHEFGHMLGFADISYDKEKQAKAYGSDSQKTIMSQNVLTLKCDDADGLVALLYLALGKDKLFRSFCEDSLFYHNGQIIDFTRILEQEQLFSSEKIANFNNFQK